jgi:4-amino-4-deoxy-L-arabinose transferase-like glycosyltransferase
MLWPYDVASTITLAATVIALAGAARKHVPMPARVALIVTAAALLRVDAAWQHSLHMWDESFHAVVATNLIEHPLRPTLYERPLTTSGEYRWTEAHIWLHKPPLAMWSMAASMAMFGTNAMAMRLPGILFSTLGVLLIFLIGRTLYNERIGLLAAGFASVSGFLVSLSSGRRVADHVDTALITSIELAVWLLVCGRLRPGWRAAAAGAAMGAGILAKSLPALVVIPIALAVWICREKSTGLWQRVFALAAGCVIVCGPWLLYTVFAFPEEAAASFRYTLLHMTAVVENQGGPWWSYLRDLPRLYGELIYLPLIWLGYRLARRRGSGADWTVGMWIAVPYVVFAAMPTKLPAFVAIAAPALFIASAAFWCALRDRLPHHSGLTRAGIAALLFLLAVLPARALLAPTGPLERRDRAPDWSREMRALDARIGLDDAVVFNHPRAVQAMFYSRHDIYARLPTDAEVRTLQAMKVPIVIYMSGPERPVIPAAWGAIVLETPAEGR